MKVHENLLIFPCRSKYFRGKKLHVDWDIRVEQAEFRNSTVLTDITVQLQTVQYLHTVQYNYRQYSTYRHYSTIIDSTVLTDITVQL